MPDLTKREHEVMDRRLAGQLLKEIAHDTGISLGAVVRHYYRAHAKLGARTSGGALRRYRQWRITNIEWYVPVVIKDASISPSSST